MTSENKNGRRLTDQQPLAVFKAIDSRLRKLETLPDQMQQLNGQIQLLNDRVQRLENQMGLVVDRLDRLIEEVIRSRTFDTGKFRDLEQRLETVERKVFGQ